MKTTLLTMLIVALILTGCTKGTHPPLETVGILDLERYQGLWYEIARYENRFEEGCEGATAYYTLKEEHVEVVNSCFADGMMIDQAKGKAYIADETSHAKLKVTFFWPFYGDYWVLMLPEDYRYSVVGDPERKYLWILSRTKKITDEDRERILARLPEFGYSAVKLYWTDHEAYPQ